MPNLRLVRGGEAPLEISAPHTMVGRDPHANIVVNDSSVSRRHAAIERRGDAWVVTDQGSANGTWIDGARVTEAPLLDGQIIRLGGVSFAVSLPADPATPPVLPPAAVDTRAPPIHVALTMTLEEAEALLGIAADATPDEIRQQYRRIYNDLQIRLTNATASSVRRMYQKNLQDLKTACEVLCPGLLQ
jgi:predicted component of type VI protein secretion system